MGCGASHTKQQVQEPCSGHLKEIVDGNKNAELNNETLVQNNNVELNNKTLVQNNNVNEIVVQDIDQEISDNRGISTSSLYYLQCSKQTGNVNQKHVSAVKNCNNLKDSVHINSIVSVQRYKKGLLIDKGAYGKVYKGVDTMTNEVVAIKYIEVSGTFEEVKKDIISLKKEISLLKKLNHPNIVKYYDFDVCEDKSGVDIILEYVPNGSLRMALNKCKYFDETKTAIYTKQILEGLQYLHKNNIIHRDLKGANLLLDQEGRAKLADFGTAKQIVSNLQKSQIGDEDIAQMNRSLKGTPNWMSPEVIERTGHASSADIWSLGCVVIEMMTGKPPYPNQTAKQVFISILSGSKRAFKQQYSQHDNVQLKLVVPEVPKVMTDECREFFKGCLQVDPKKRLTATQLLETPFIQRRKIRRLESQNSLFSQEELLEQINSIQRQQNIQQQYQFQKKGSLVSIANSGNSKMNAPLIISHCSSKDKHYVQNSQPIIQIQSNQNQDSTQLSRNHEINSKDRIRNLNHNGVAQNHHCYEDDIKQISLAVKDQQDQMQSHRNDSCEQQLRFQSDDQIYNPKRQINIVQIQALDQPAQFKSTPNSQPNLVFKEEEELLCENGAVKFQREDENKNGQKQEERQNQKENEYQKHENKIIWSKSASHLKMALNKQEQRQLQSCQKDYYEHQDQVIDTDIAKRERNLVDSEKKELVQDKQKRQLVWEEELRLELEFQKSNPLPYLKY